MESKNVMMRTTHNKIIGGRSNQSIPKKRNIC